MKVIYTLFDQYTPASAPKLEVEAWAEDRVIVDCLRPFAGKESLLPWSHDATVAKVWVTANITVRAWADWRGLEPPGWLFPNDRDLAYRTVATLVRGFADATRWRNEIFVLTALLLNVPGVLLARWVAANPVRTESLAEAFDHIVPEVRDHRDGELRGMARAIVATHSRAADVPFERRLAALADYDTHILRK